MAIIYLIMIMLPTAKKGYRPDSRDYTTRRNNIHDFNVSVILLFSMVTVWALIPLYKYRVVILLFHAILLSCMRNDIPNINVHMFEISGYMAYLALGTHISSMVPYGRMLFDIISVMAVAGLHIFIMNEGRIIKRALITDGKPNKYDLDYFYVIDCEKVLFKEYKNLKSVISIEKFMNYIIKEGINVPEAITSKLMKRVQTYKYPMNLMIVNVTNLKVALSIAKELNRYYDKVVTTVPNN